MLEQMAGIKSSKIVINLCVYMVCIIPSYIFLYKIFKLGFWIILIIENILTYNLLDIDEIWDIIMKDIQGKYLIILLISTIVFISMLGWSLIRFTQVFLILIMAEIVCYILFQLKKILRIRFKRF